jgi:hemolysin activation/secretion protein
MGKGWPQVAHHAGLITGADSPRRAWRRRLACWAEGALCAVSMATLPMPVAAQATLPAPPPPPVRTPSVVPPASELTPRSTPDSEATLPVRKTPPRELGKPDDDVKVDVARYVVDDDAPPELRAALAGLTAAYIGPQRSFEDLVNAAGEVTRYLQRELGDYLGYAYLPEQTPDNSAGGSSIRIAVLEGRLDRVVLNWREGIAVDREVVEAYLARLKPDSVLKVRDLERVVFLVNDLRGMTASFELRAGAEPGTATLVVTPSPERTWSGKAEFDVNGSQPLGRYRFSGQAQMNSPFGRGDGFTGNALISTTGGLGFVLLGYTTPVGSDGIKVGTSLSAVQYQLDKVAFPLNLKGNASTLNVYGLYPLVRARNLNLFTLLSLEHKQYVDKQVEVDGLSRKTVDTVAVGATGDFRDAFLGGAVSTYEANLVSGSVKYPLGRNPALDDDPTFAKLNVGYTRLQDWFTNRALVYFAFRGQMVAKNLDTTEQFRLGGPDGVRAFAAGEGTGDLGAVTSLELRLLPPEDWFGRIAREMVFSAFADAGYVKFRYRPRVSADPNVGKNNAVLSGAGFGLSWVHGNDYSLRLSVAKAISGQSISSEAKSGVRLYLQAAKLFN